MRRSMMGRKKLQLFTKRFYPAGNYTWIVPKGCREVDVFLVGAGGGSYHVTSMGWSGGGGGGYTKAYRGKGYVKPSSGTWITDEKGGKDGDAISVTPGQVIQIIVGAGVYGADGGYSQFVDSNYRANGGNKAYGWTKGGNGGSGGGTSLYNGKEVNGIGGSDGENGNISDSNYGKGQGHTTRDFGESSGKRNAGGGAPISKVGESTSYPGSSDYTEGTGLYSYDNTSEWRSGAGGGGYGGGAGSNIYINDKTQSLKGGDGTVLIRYWAYEE